MIKRIRREVPPYLSLADSVNVIIKVHSMVGDSATKDDLAKIFGNPFTSSSFVKKLAALKSWGLLYREGSKFRITSDAAAISMPISEIEKKQALRHCFLNVDILRKIAIMFAGKLLPEDTFFSSALRRDLNIDSSISEAWVRTFKEAGNLVELFIDIRGKLQVRQEIEKVESNSSALLGQYKEGKTAVIEDKPKLPDKENTLVEIIEDETEPKKELILRMGSLYFRGPRASQVQDKTDIHAFMAWFKAVYGNLLDEND